MNFSTEDVISIVVFVGGLLGVWYALKHKVDRNTKCNLDMSKAIDSLKKSVDKDIEKLEKRIEKNNDNIITEMKVMNKTMNDNHLEVIKMLQSR